MDGLEEVHVAEFAVGVAVGPSGIDAEFVAPLEPVGDLLDGGLFEVGGQGGLANPGVGAGQDVAAGVGDAGLRRNAEC